MDTKVKTGLTHAGTAVAAAYATFAFVADNKVDLYAIWDQLNVVIAQITKFIALVTPMATAAYGVYRSTAGARIAELTEDPRVKGIVTTSAIADASSSNKVQSTAADLPAAAKT